MISYLKNFYNDSTRKDLLTVLQELSLLLLSSGHLPIHYFTRFAYRRGIDPKNFISNQSFTRYLRAANNKRYSYLVNDKLVFSLILRNFGIPQPTTYAFSYNGKIILIKNGIPSSKSLRIEEVPAYFFETFNCQSVFFKRVDGEWGLDAFYIDKEKPQVSSAELMHKIQEGYWILQERVIQHEALAKINESSLNTIRIDTFLKKNDEVEIFSALLRVGRKDSMVDNGSAGGFFIGVEKNGRLKEKGYTYLKNGADQVLSHPDSSISFKDFQVPYWTEIKNLVREAAVLFPHIKAIGWDIAVTPEGPFVIEANDNYQLGMSEVAAGGYANNKNFLKNFQQVIAKR